MGKILKKSFEIKQISGFQWMEHKEYCSFYH